MAINLILSCVLLVLDVIAIMNIVKSTVSGGSKVLWVLVVVLIPVLGLIVYFVTHRKKLT